MVQLNYIAGHKKLLTYPAGQCLIQGFSTDFGPWTTMPIQISPWNPKKVISFHCRKTYDWCVKGQKKKVLHLLHLRKSSTNQMESLHCRMTRELVIIIHA